MESHDKYHSVVFFVDKQKREIRFYRGRERFLRPKRVIEIWDEGVMVGTEYDESDPESVPGEAPRAGNIVYIVRNM